ncbi:MAG TPA: hypothetical protein VFK06_02605 [Candidatus Angelobacter sp.]|nr:hypothetical protein [Candidatus Angelobacter sp.]
MNNPVTVFAKNRLLIEIMYRHLVCFEFAIQQRITTSAAHYQNEEFWRRSITEGEDQVSEPLMSLFGNPGVTPPGTPPTIPPTRGPTGFFEHELSAVARSRPIATRVVLLAMSFFLNLGSSSLLVQATDARSPERLLGCRQTTPTLRLPSTFQRNFQINQTFINNAG